MLHAAAAAASAAAVAAKLQPPLPMAVAPHQCCPLQLHAGLTPGMVAAQQHWQLTEALLVLPLPQLCCLYHNRQWPLPCWQLHCWQHETMTELLLLLLLQIFAVLRPSRPPAHCVLIAAAASRQGTGQGR